MRPNIFILEDSEERIKWFKENFNFANLDMYDNVEDAELGFDGPYDLIFCDHDLDFKSFVPTKDKNTGSEFCRWLVKEFPNSDLDIVVHSMNPIGVQYMVDKLREKFKHVSNIPFNELKLGWMMKQIEILGHTHE